MTTFRSPDQRQEGQRAKQRQEIRGSGPSSQGRALAILAPRRSPAPATASDVHSRIRRLPVVRCRWPVACSLALLLAALCLWPVAARADTVGLFAPSAPFSGSVARLDFVSALAGHLGQGWNGKAYARATDFAAAVKRGEVQYAVIDAPYLAALGVPYRVLATAERGGATSAPWEVISATPATGLVGLRGKTIAIPDVGHRADAFLTEVLLEGELGKDFFAQVVQAPDALSALAAVERGRADAAIVPSGLPLPAGMRRVVSLRSISWPLLVALPGAAETAPEAAATFRSQVFTRFVTGGGDAVRALAGRFSRRPRRAPLLIPDLREAASALVAGRSFTIPRGDPRAYIVSPPVRISSGSR